MLVNFKLISFIVLFYAALYLSISMGYTNAWAIPTFIMPFSIILPIAMFILALVPLFNISSKLRKQLLIYGIILMVTPFIELKLKDYYDKQIEDSQVQQNNNNVVVV